MPEQMSHWTVGMLLPVGHFFCFVFRLLWLGFSKRMLWLLHLALRCGRGWAFSKWSLWLWFQERPSCLGQIRWRVWKLAGWCGDLRPAACRHTPFCGFWLVCGKRCIAKMWCFTRRRAPQTNLEFRFGSLEFRWVIGVVFAPRPVTGPACQNQFPVEISLFLISLSHFILVCVHFPRCLEVIVFSLSTQKRKDGTNSFPLVVPPFEWRQDNRHRMACLRPTVAVPSVSVWRFLDKLTQVLDTCILLVKQRSSNLSENVCGKYHRTTQADPGGPGSPGTLTPRIFSNSCRFQAILRRNPLFWVNFWLRASLGSKLCWPPD